MQWGKGAGCLDTSAISSPGAGGGYARVARRLAISLPGAPIVHLITSILFKPLIAGPCLSCAAAESHPRQEEVRE